MKPRLLDLLACPECHCPTLHLKVSRGGREEDEIEEGTLGCPGCGLAFPIKDGIPRLLPLDLRPAPEAGGRAGKEGTLLTGRGYDFHHRRSGSAASTAAAATLGHVSDLALARRYFLDYLAVNEAQLKGLQGQVVLDAGCGAGRFMAVVGENGPREVVGLDLSQGGLLTAQILLNGAGGFHFVQGDIARPPFKPGVFETIYSIGVLHHLENPEKGFQALKPMLADGGQMWVWVYGLECMSLGYRLSHLVWLRRLTRTWSIQEKYQLCRKLALVFDLLYLGPLKWAKKVLPPSPGRDRPFPSLARWDHYSREDMLYAFFDRLQPPYTHYLRREQLEQYLADLKEVVISNPGKRGWVAKGRKA